MYLFHCFSLLKAAPADVLLAEVTRLTAALEARQKDEEFLMQEVQV
jgi:hypothetical protein